MLAFPLNCCKAKMREIGNLSGRPSRATRTVPRDSNNSLNSQTVKHTTGGAIAQACTIAQQHRRNKLRPLGSAIRALRSSVTTAVSREAVHAFRISGGGGGRQKKNKKREKVLLCMRHENGFKRVGAGWNPNTCAIICVYNGCARKRLKHVL